jgi:hypothetical protein
MRKRIILSAYAILAIALGVVLFARTCYTIALNPVATSVTHEIVDWQMQLMKEMEQRKLLEQVEEMRELALPPGWTRHEFNGGVYYIILIQ